MEEVLRSHVQCVCVCVWRGVASCTVYHVVPVVPQYAHVCGDIRLRPPVLQPAKQVINLVPNCPQLHATLLWSSSTSVPNMVLTGESACSLTWSN